MKPCFGWDLAGYGRSGSGLCRADRQGDTITATILRATFVCRPNLAMKSEIESTTEIEKEMLRRFAEVGTSFIDVPIDLQSLLRIADYRADERVSHYWRLVKRPVDHAFCALEPLGSNVGYAVARLAHLLGSLPESRSSLILGESLFETYPAATLQLVRAANERTDLAYKGGRVEFVGGQWQPLGTKQKLTTQTREKRVALAELATCLRLRSEEGFRLDDDEFDAIICAITGCIPESAVKGDVLRATICRRLGVQETTVREAEPPRGYIVIENVPSNIQIDVRAVSCRTPADLFAAIGSSV